MDAYVKWFESEGENGQRAVAVLRLLGLFDRPASAECIEALKRAPVIPGLTEILVGATEAQWNIILTRLEEVKLLAANRDRAGALLSLDAHPLLREYFARLVRTGHPNAWRAAHQRLYETLISNAEERPATLEGLEGIYQAVRHGCEAHLPKHVWDEIFEKRLERDSHFATLRLGAIDADLAALSCFFDAPWSRIDASLPLDYKAKIYCHVAFRLRGVGRLTEAIEPSEQGLAIDTGRSYWRGAAIIANNLSELYLALGNIPLAVGVARDALTYARNSLEWVEIRDELTTLADALTQQDKRDDALQMFSEAEVLQVKEEPIYPLLYSMRGFKYCDFILSLAERTAWELFIMRSSSRSTVREARNKIEGKVVGVVADCRAIYQRAAQTLQWAEENSFSLLTIALDHLTLGRSALYAAILGSSKPDLRTGTSHVTVAVDGLRHAGQQQYIPLGLLNRAWLRFLTGQHTGFESAQADLDEAWEIAERGPMPLFLADIHLYRARLFGNLSDTGGATYPWGSPAVDLVEARRLIEKHCYEKRKNELEVAEKSLG